MTAALAILAGGRGARLQGVVKPLLVRPDGRTLIEHLNATLAPLVEETLIVAPAEIGHLFNGTVIADPGEGPGLALFAAAKATSCDRILLAAGDHVAPSRALAERLLSAGELAVVSLEGVLQPGFAVYATAKVRRIDPPPTSLMAILAAIDPVVIDGAELSPEARAAFEDVDTEEDVARHRLTMEGVPRWSYLADRRG